MQGSDNTPGSINHYINTLTSIIHNLDYSVTETEENVFKVFDGDEYTGVYLDIYTDENETLLYISTDNFFPKNAHPKFFMHSSDLNPEPYVFIIPHSKKSLTMAIEFLGQALFFYHGTRQLRTWECASCGVKGYEKFLNNDGSINTVDENGDIFYLVAYETEQEGINLIHDETSDQYILPLCKNCIDESEFSPMEDADSTDLLEQVDEVVDGFEPLLLEDDFEQLSNQERITLFFDHLIQRMQAEESLHSHLSSPKRDNWITTRSHIPGIEYLYRIRKNDGAVELYFDPQHSRERDILELFDALEEDNSKICKELGENLIWENAPDTRSRKILLNIDTGGYATYDRWPAVQAEMINKMELLSSLLSRYNTDKISNGFMIEVPYDGDIVKAEIDNNTGYRFLRGLDGYEQDYAKAFKLFTSASNAGNEAAKLNLAAMYWEGLGIEQSPENVEKLLLELAKDGNAKAQYNLGILYIDGLGDIPQDEEEAAFWWQTAAKNGDREAQCNLGLLYHSGKGVEKSPDNFLYWIEKAADQGDEKAVQILEVIQKKK